MRQLTFPGFLNRYVRDLSTENTGALYSLVDETMNGNYRLKEQNDEHRERKWT